ncbi:MAG: alkane 1-monooxygenase [Candidatus Neomarinimicrobiota bacterium]|nr:alkane 1-monooxygenase [Candidatus Neomarinimicrobiota bacterium]
MKYLKYYISTLTLVVAIYVCTLGTNFPTIFFIGFSMFIILGDILLSHDDHERTYKNTFLLNLPMYINLPLLLLLLFIVVFMLGEDSSNAFSSFLLTHLNIDIVYSRESINTLDSISLVALSGLFIGTMGTVSGHELVHRKKDKFDLFMGNWLLAMSWDCAFAVEHVYGHHKNVGLDIDPATAKRGENIYAFIIRAIVKEQKDAWLIELDQLKRRDMSVLSLNNRMIFGYLRSIIITAISFLVGGIGGMLIFLLCAFVAKSLLEVINYSEHYGLVRVPGEIVQPRHSWNSNSTMSSIYLYNVTRHSSHHEKANLKYWELRAYEGAPMMPQGYLTMLYLAIFAPYFFHRMMAKKLIEWDNKYATEKEKILASEQNKNSGVSFLMGSGY